MSDLWPWLAVFGLGIFHGINPAMGWLFAVALGLQEQKRVAVFRALPPMVLGHALSIAIIIAAVLLARVSLPHRALKIAAAVVLFAFGFYRVLRSRHPNWVGMRVGFGDLTLWSFVMASAHGAGLMVLPIILSQPPSMPAEHHMHMAGLPPSLGVEAMLVHTFGYLVVTAAIALIVYLKLGLALLRTAWFNLDRIWAFALIATGCLALILLRPAGV